MNLFTLPLKGGAKSSQDVLVGNLGTHRIPLNSFLLVVTTLVFVA
ncbi:hypothetical protein [Pseudacidovorax sp. NFM-22]|nr:hypothetical protein [Pseudacidovorax sp. NFM-22]